MEHEEKKAGFDLSTYALPIAIVAAGVLIAGAIVYTNLAPNEPKAAELGEPTAGLAAAAELHEDDYVRGNPDAAVTFIEYSDYECPFCQVLHPTLTRLVAENENVKWVYRHFPLTSIHSQALASAVAGECAGRVGGSNAFWQFTDRLFANQTRLGSELYVGVAQEINLDLEAFKACISEPDVTQHVRSEYEEAVAAGADGTPYVVVVTSSGEVGSFSGALQYEHLQSIVEQAL